MKYLCLIYDEEKKMSALPKAEQEQLMADYFAFTDDVQKKGHTSQGKRCIRSTVQRPCGCAMDR